MMRSRPPGCAPAGRSRHGWPRSSASARRCDAPEFDHRADQRIGRTKPLPGRSQRGGSPAPWINARVELRRISGLPRSARWQRDAKTSKARGNPAAPPPRRSTGSVMLAMTRAPSRSARRSRRRCWDTRFNRRAHHMPLWPRSEIAMEPQPPGDGSDRFRFGFRFEKTVTILRLSSPRTDPPANQVRYTLGFRFYRQGR